MRIGPRAALALAAVAIGLAAGWVNRERVALDLLAARVGKTTLAAREALLAPAIEYLPPEGVAPPYPTVIQFHGCGGMRPAFMRQWADVANAAGFMAVIVDSYAPRGIARERALETVCKGKELIGQERAGDVLAAYDIVRQRSDVDAGRIVLAGWSHGAWSVMDLLALGGAAPAGLAGGGPEPAPAGVIAVYPYCGVGARSRISPWRARPATLAFIAGADTVVDPKECTALFEKMNKAGLEAQVVVYPDADHVFDDRHLPDEFKHFFNGEALADAERRYAEFLSQIAGR
jgi:dienelactone hydrolase